VQRIKAIAARESVIRRPRLVHRPLDAQDDDGLDRWVHRFEPAEERLDDLD
jgi:hypothetical protein